MDFRLSLEQEMLRDSARRYIETEQSFEHRARRIDGSAHDDWTKLAELGWLALGIPEEMGGLGRGIEDLAILAEEMGRGLSLDPFIECAVLPARILFSSDDSKAREHALRAIANNAGRIAVALHEKSNRYDLSSPDLQAEKMVDGSYRLSGKKIVVMGSKSAKQLIVSARITESGVTKDKLALFLIDVGHSGVDRRPYQLINDGEASDVLFVEVTVPADSLLVFSGGTQECLEDAIDDAIVCQCADTLGAIEKAIEMTADYLKVRTQFGRPLADFQVLQHTLAEMFIEATNARSILYRAIAALSSSRQERRRAVSACKIKLMESAKWVAGTAIHLHGGIGMTCEYPVGHYLRRIMVAERTFGDGEHHMKRYLSAVSA